MTNERPSDAAGNVRSRRPLAERFWRHVERSASGCWRWTASCNPHGYGYIKVDGRVRLAHRVAWTLFRGEPPDGIGVLHRCDNPPCVNPAHLFLGSQAVNLADMSAKGRGARSLSADQVQRIREDAASGASSSVLSEKFAVSKTTIKHIKARRTWKYLQ